MRIERVRPHTMNPDLIDHREKWHRALALYDGRKDVSTVDTAVRKQLVRYGLITGIERRDAITSRGTDLLERWNKRHGRVTPDRI